MHELNGTIRIGNLSLPTTIQVTHTDHTEAMTREQWNEIRRQIFAPQHVWVSGPLTIEHLSNLMNYVFEHDHEMICGMTPDLYFAYERWRYSRYKQCIKLAKRLVHKHRHSYHVDHRRRLIKRRIGHI